MPFGRAGSVPAAVPLLSFPSNPPAQVLHALGAALGRLRPLPPALPLFVLVSARARGIPFPLSPSCPPRQACGLVFAPGPVGPLREAHLLRVRSGVQPGVCMSIAPVILTGL